MSTSICFPGVTKPLVSDSTPFVLVSMGCIFGTTAVFDSIFSTLSSIDESVIIGSTCCFTFGTVTIESTSGVMDDSESTTSMSICTPSISISTA